MIMRKTSDVQRIAIAGSGPAGSTLACLLAKAGKDVVIFDNEKRPDIVVGESLVPRLVNTFRLLGIEDQVAKLGTYKPGVTWIVGNDAVLDLSFAAMEGVLPTYAYNVPRREFDTLVQDTDEKAGARFIPGELKIDTAEVNGTTIPILSEEALAKVPDWNGQQPDLMIDSTGRRRLFSKALGIKADIGHRKDAAYMAHYEGCKMPEPAGQTISTPLAHGWAGRIPLIDCLSIGVVIDKEAAKKYGTTPEEILEGCIDADPHMAPDCANRKRITDVSAYTNYQLISHQGHGPNWTALGDAFGFADPMLSPGLCLAMTSAEELANRILGKPRPLDQSLGEYIAWFRNMLSCWQDLIEYFYDGRIFAMHMTGTEMMAKHPVIAGNWMRRHIEKNLAGMAGGGLTDRGYSRGLLRFIGKYGIRGYDPKDYAIV